MNFNEGISPPARLVVLLLALIGWSLAGCSAVELYRSNASATAEAEAGLAAATEDPTFSALEGALADIRSTEQSLSVAATGSSATITALEAKPTTEPTAAEGTPQVPVSAETILYGSVPIDSDRLNIIAALAFDADGQLFVATRAGEVYNLPDIDDDGVADETRLVFADEAEELGPVAGMTVRDAGLLLLNGGRLSLLRDEDGDGAYESATHLAAGLPADQSPLQAGNGIVFAPDGRLFTADVNSGEILQILLSE